MERAVLIFGIEKSWRARAGQMSLRPRGRFETRTCERVEEKKAEAETGKKKRYGYGACNAIQHG
jgi:hypothetical protein